MQIETPRPEPVRGVRFPRQQQRLGGALIALVSGGSLAWTWYAALSRGYFYENGAMFAPAFLVIGVALILIPGYREERIARGQDISRIRGSKLITPRWWAVIVTALAASLLNELLLYGVI